MTKLLESADEHIQTPPISPATRHADIISYSVWLYYRFTLRVQAILGGIWFVLSITGISGKVRLEIGPQQWYEVKAILSSVHKS